MKQLITMCALVLLGTAPAWGQTNGNVTRVGETHSLEALARDARTATDHASVAKQYRERSEALHQEATRLEQELRKLPAQARSSMASKWPAMDLGDRKAANLRTEALNARQAAHEASLTATRHHQLAVEKGFAANAN